MCVLICSFVTICFSPKICPCYHIPLRFLVGGNGPTGKVQFPQYILVTGLRGFIPYMQRVGAQRLGFLQLDNWNICFCLVRRRWHKFSILSKILHLITPYAFLETNLLEAYGVPNMVSWAPSLDQRSPCCSAPI